MFYRRRIDPSAYLVLWQVGVAADRSVRRSSTGRAHRRLLVARLAADYPADHVVTLYEAATPQLGRAPCRERVCPSAYTSAVPVTSNTKTTTSPNNNHNQNNHQ